MKRPESTDGSSKGCSTKLQRCEAKSDESRVRELDMRVNRLWRANREWTLAGLKKALALHTSNQELN
jgi:hypothetical protein